MKWTESEGLGQHRAWPASAARRAGVDPLLPFSGLHPGRTGAFGLCGGSELLPQGRSGRHLPPMRSAAGAGRGTCSSHPRESWQSFASLNPYRHYQRIHGKLESVQQREMYREGGGSQSLLEYSVGGLGRAHRRAWQRPSAPQPGRYTHSSFLCRAASAAGAAPQIGQRRAQPVHRAAARCSSGRPLRLALPRTLLRLPLLLLLLGRGGRGEHGLRPVLDVVGLRGRRRDHAAKGGARDDVPLDVLLAPTLLICRASAQGAGGCSASGRAGAGH